MDAFTSQNLLGPIINGVTNFRMVDYRVFPNGNGVTPPPENTSGWHYWRAENLASWRIGIIYPSYQSATYSVPQTTGVIRTASLNTPFIIGSQSVTLQWKEIISVTSGDLTVMISPATILLQGATDTSAFASVWCFFTWD